MFFSIEFGILSRPRALPFPEYLRHRLYVLLSNEFVIAPNKISRFPSTNPSRSRHGYCLTPHVHVFMMVWFVVACMYHWMI
jgi:hypothetical protein